MVIDFTRSKGVKLNVHERFFDMLEKERVREQTKISKKFGRIIPLSQRKFTEILAMKQIQFVPMAKLNKKRRKRR